MVRTFRLILLLLTLCASTALGQQNGKLQIHFINVGQGDGALLISPQGETVLFDNGVLNYCDKPRSYLQQLGLQKIDYHVASHYHADHIGCTDEVFGEFPLQKFAYDRGSTYGSATFTTYQTTVGTKRKTATNQTIINLDPGTSPPVRVKIVALNGNGVNTQNENDKSLVAVVECGEFSAVIGGDLSGYSTPSYKDIETSVGPKVGRVDVYKVNHHGSDHSTNETWLQAIRPTVGIISAGEGNSYGHPTAGCLERLHTAGLKTSWTTVGNGAPPDPAFDVVGGNIVIEADPGGDTFTVTTGNGRVDTYSSLEGGVVPGPGGPVAGGSVTYVWSVRSQVYHHAECSYTDNISASNRRAGNEPPTGKRLHEGCPR
jgi:beta-lactamase superfamily II metal-dependent hydrolase